MTNYKITVQYDGTRYNGWQRQGNTKNTIQEKFENVLSLMCGRSIGIFASGRTDAGVHAVGQVANFMCDTHMSDSEIMDYLNHYLPEDIAVLSIERAEERFHSRLNAVSKTYEYTLCCGKADVFVRKYVCKTDAKPDTALMRSAARKLLGTHDFIGFSSVKKAKKSTVRTINSIDITENGNLVSIRINGTGFLYNMVRIISGTLYDIGTGKLDESIIDSVFETGHREAAGITLPACGLKLIAVYYK